MIQRLIYLCPLCASADWLCRRRCRHCGAVMVVQGRRELAFNDSGAPIADWYDRVRSFTLRADADGVLLSAHGVRLYREHYRGWRRLAGGLEAGRYVRRPAGCGRLVLSRDALVFTGARTTRVISLRRVTGVTIESNTVIVGVAHGPALFFRFEGGIGKRWEDALRSALDDRFRPERLIAYYPRLRKAGDDASRPGAAVVEKADRSCNPGSGRPVLFLLLRPIVRALIYPWLPVAVHGRHHVPTHGPAVILPNHASFLDAIILGAALPRPIRFMTKDSEFYHPAMAYLLGRLGAFPVRRYSVDAQAVRNARRIVGSGQLLGLFPEGERSWDGRMLPLRRGALRLLLTLGVPIVPAGIAGAYPVMPRWTHWPRPHPVSIRFGPPVVLPAPTSGRHRPEEIAALDRLLTHRVSDLLHGLS